MVTENRYDADGEVYAAETQPGKLSFSIDISSNLGENTPPSMAYRLIMRVTEATRIDPHVFVFESVPTAAGRDPDTLRFSNVASPADMQEFPVDLPSSDSLYRCRKSEVDLYFRSVDDLESARDALIMRVNALLGEIESMSRMRRSMTVEFTFDTDEVWADSSFGG